jgi:hypothetical protein
MASLFDFDQLDIDEDRSLLAQLDGKRIKRLSVTIKKPGDAAHIASCKSVDWLVLRGWKEPDLSALAGLAVKSLHLVRGSQTSLKGLNIRRLKFLWVHACGRLRTLEIPRLAWLNVWASNNLDLDSLGSIRGLAGLDIGMRKAIDSLAFVARRRSLRFLTIDAYAWKTNDSAPLGQAPALEIAGFTRLRKPTIEAISKVNRRLLVGGTGCDCYMCNGRPATEEEYMKLRRALNKEYGS